MSFDEIMAELPRLTPEQRQVLWARLEELEDDDELTPAEMALIEDRLAEYRRNPTTGISWQEMEARLRDRLRQ